MQPLRLAMLGCGGIMHKHAGHAEHVDALEVVGLCDVSDANISRLVERHYADHPPPRFHDPAEMYEQTRPDAVVIATPHTLHHAQACQALDAGCHILMEKPMVTDLDQAYDLERRVEQAGKVFCIAYNTPCSAEMYTIRQWVRHETFGKLKLVSLNLSQNWYRWTKDTWRQDPSLSGGGQLYDSGAHPLSSLIWTVESDVDEAYAHIDRLDSPVDINGTATVRFANGVLASIGISGEGPNGAQGAWIFERARVEVNPWLIDRIELVKVPEGRGLGNERVKYPEMLGPDEQPLTNFIHAIRGTDEPRTTPRNGVQHSQLMDAIYRSAESAQPAKPRKQ